jgi:hypothetical protein
MNKCLPQVAANDASTRSNQSVPNSALSRQSRVLEAGANDSATARSDHQYPDGREIVAYLISEMIEHSTEKNPDFLQIKKLLDTFKAIIEPVASAPRVAALFQALAAFQAVVGYDKVWDQKSAIKARWGKNSELVGVIVPSDVWSNIHYGFIGRQIGFNTELLKRAAGFAQARNFSVPDGWLGRWLVQDLPLLSSLDDPRDQEAIALGMVLSDRFGRSVTDADLIKEMRPRLGRLIELN